MTKELIVPLAVPGSGGGTHAVYLWDALTESDAPDKAYFQTCE